MKSIAVLMCLLSAPILAAPTVQPGTPIHVQPDVFSVQSNATVSSSSGKVVCSLSWSQVSLIINAKGTFTGSPTLTYTLSEVDPGDLSTAFTGAMTTTGAAIPAAGSQVLTLTGQVSPCVKVAWTFTGTSITQVYTTLTARTSVTDSVYDGIQSGTVSAQCSDANIQSCGASSTVSIPMAGQFGASVSVPAASTLVTVLKPDCGYLQPDLSTVLWEPTLFDDPQTGDKTVSYTTVSGTINSLSIVGCHGASHLRVRASSSPTGSGVLVMRSSFLNDPSLLFTGGNGSTNQPPSTAQVGGWTGTKIQPVGVDETFRAFHVSQRPPEVLGCWSLGGSQAYTATTSGGIIFSFRWGDATRFALVLRVQVLVIATAFTTAGLVERQLVVVRSFTASDTGGTSVLPGANSNELRTSFPTTLLTDARFGGFLTAGTGTADAQPLATVANWMGAVGNVIGAGQFVPLLDASGGFQYPLTLAQNEGFRIKLNATETASTRQTFVNVVWCEATAF